MSENKNVGYSTKDIRLTPQGRKNRRRAIFYFVMAITAVLIFFIVAFTVFIRVSEVKVTGNSFYSEDTIKSIASIDTDIPLYSFNINEIESKLSHNLPYINAVCIKRILPSTVEIEVKEEEARFYLNVYDDYYVISDSFRVIERLGKKPAAERGLIPLKTGYVGECVLGNELTFSEEKLTRSLKELWSALKRYGIDGSVTYIEASNRFDIAIGYEDRFRVYFGSADECDAKIKFFKEILKYTYEDQKGTFDISDKKEGTFSPSE